MLGEKAFLRLVFIREWRLTDNSRHSVTAEGIYMRNRRIKCVAELGD